MSSSSPEKDERGLDGQSDKEKGPPSSGAKDGSSAQAGTAPVAYYGGPNDPRLGPVPAPLATHYDKICEVLKAQSVNDVAVILMKWAVRKAIRPTIDTFKAQFTSDHLMHEVVMGKIIYLKRHLLLHPEDKKRINLLLNDVLNWTAEKPERYKTADGKELPLVLFTQEVIRRAQILVTPMYEFDVYRSTQLKQAHSILEDLLKRVTTILIGNSRAALLDNAMRFFRGNLETQTIQLGDNLIGSSALSDSGDENYEASESTSSSSSEEEDGHAF